MSSSTLSAVDTVPLTETPTCFLRKKLFFLLNKNQFDYGSLLFPLGFLSFCWSFLEV